jgi:Ca2+-binding EF-hand superfamily protein
MTEKQLKEALKTLFMMADASQEGSLRPESFAIFLRHVSTSLLRDQDLQLCGPMEINFQYFDLDHDGRISFDEIWLHMRTIVKVCKKYASSDEFFCVRYEKDVLFKELDFVPSLKAFEKWSNMAFNSQFLMRIEAHQNYKGKVIEGLTFIFSNGCQSPQKGHYKKCLNTVHMKLFKDSAISQIKFGIGEFLS